MTKSTYLVPERNRPGRDPPAGPGGGRPRTGTGRVRKRLPRRPFGRAGRVLRRAGSGYARPPFPWHADGGCLTRRFLVTGRAPNVNLYRDRLPS
jgi:hypothetical protein